MFTQLKVSTYFRGDGVVGQRVAEESGVVEHAAAIGEAQLADVH
jgi:hypothetical protein